MSEPAETIHLSPEAATHELRTLIASAPIDVQWYFDLDRILAGQDRAREKAEWCEAWATKILLGYHREFFLRAAAILRSALPWLPEHAPPDPPDTRQSVDKDYSAAVAKADRRYWRTRR